MRDRRLLQRRLGNRWVRRLIFVEEVFGSPLTLIKMVGRDVAALGLDLRLAAG